MGSKRKTVIKNSSIGLISQACGMLFTFVTRSLFIRCIGVELLGLNSTFFSVLNALSLAELGFETAVVYNLYRPLHDHDEAEINATLNILKYLYRGVGIFLILAVMVLTPFLRVIVTGIPVTAAVYAFFWLQAAATVCTYFLAYKRAILYADQKEYVSKTADIVCSVLFNIIQCVVLVTYGSYVVYLILKVVQTCTSNLVIHFYCSRHYSYLHRVPLDKARLLKILRDVRNIFAGKVAGFIYNSTDNLVISAFVSTVTVGYFVNYTTITSGLKALSSSILSPIVPVLGSHLLDEEDGDKRERVLALNTFARYLLALSTVVPMSVLAGDFIIWWVGEDMVLGNAVVLLLCMDLYIHLVHGAASDFINSAGLFRSEKYVEMLGALCNIVMSVVLVRYWGIAGVLIGTVVSQIVFWIGRSAVVYRECLKVGAGRYVRYWLWNLYFILAAVLMACVVRLVYAQVHIPNVLVRFIAGGVISELLIVIMAILLFGRRWEMKELKRAFLRGRDDARAGEPRKIVFFINKSNGFPGGMISYMEEHFPEQEMQFYTVDRRCEEELPALPNVHRIRSYREFLRNAELIRHVRRADKIIVSGVFTLQYVLPIYGKSVLQKTWWQFWGGDYEDLQRDGRSIDWRDRFNERVIRHDLKRAAGIILLTRPERETFLRIFPFAEGKRMYYVPVPESKEKAEAVRRIVREYEDGDSPLRESSREKDERKQQVIVRDSEDDGDDRLRKDGWEKSQPVQRNVWETEAEEDGDGQLQKSGTERGERRVRIVIGNSATESNRHLELFEMLRGLNTDSMDTDETDTNGVDTDGPELWCPLSYGNAAYREEVIRRGRELFGERFHPITQYMCFEEYMRFLYSCSVGIYYNSRQQALGNISRMLAMGKKVFLPEGLRAYFDEYEFITFRSEDLAECDVRELLQFSEEERLHNLDCAGRQRQAMDRTWKDIIEG